MGLILGLEKIEKRKENYQTIKNDIVENADVCVIGSGAAGAVIATKIAKSGKSVVLLEKGGYYDSEDMNQRETDMIPLLWKNAGANFTDNLRMVIAQGQCLGGSTVINDAVCFKIPSIVSEQWRKLGVQITDEQWETATDEVWKNIHVTRVSNEELNKNNLMLKKACEIKGFRSRPNDRNCKDCKRCGFCHLGCHYETKQDMLVTYIHDALKNTNVRIFCNCDVDRITHENGLANGVEGTFRDFSNNPKFKIRINSKIVVVAAGSIASSHLLLKNKIGLGKTGKGLALHPAPFLLGKFPEKINSFEGIPMAYACDEFGVTNGVKNGGYVIESIFLPIFQFAMGLPSFFAEHESLMRNFPHYSMAGVMIRDESNGTINLSENGNPRVSYHLSPRDIDTIAEGIGVLADMWFEAGATHVISGHKDMITLISKHDIPKLIKAIRTNPDGLQVASAHPQGGNKMGEDETTSVVDSNCKVHGFDNLFVCDASVFPTSIGVNPQVTIMALATLTANHILKTWDTKFANSSPPASLGKTCSLKQPMWCHVNQLDAMFNQQKNQFDLETLVNVNENSVNDEKWKFDKDSLIIYNNKFWRGFYPQDQELSMAKYFGGFWKKFYKENDLVKGITRPFEFPNNVDNIPEIKHFDSFGEVIHLKYPGIGFQLFYDLLKIIDKDTILGKAFFGIPPSGNQILTFCMSRKYSAEFMDESDHEEIYKNFSEAPQEEDVIGRWHGKLVSDSSITPVTQIFTYEKQNGKLGMEYVFGGLLRGISRITLTPEQMNMYDFTNWHDELKIVNKDFMVGKWCSPWINISLDFGPSFLSVETNENTNQSRFCLRFILTKQ
jgi:choline dehydrogenase-like flavoprotein